MGIIAKSYYISHIEKLIITASSWRRPFDDLYDAINGRLDADNLSSNFRFLSSQVNYSDSTGFFSGTSVAASLLEIIPKGYHDMHFVCYAQKLCIFPGRAEVGGNLARIKTRINLNITALSFISGSLVAGNTIGVFLNQEANITQSDIFLYNVTANTLQGSVHTGLYNSTATSSKRGLFSFIWMESSNAQAWEFLTPPVSPFSYRWADSEAIAHPVFSFSYNATSARVSSIIQTMNLSTYRYEYDLAGNISGTSNACRLLNGLSASLDDAFTIDRYCFTDGVNNWATNGYLRNSAVTFVGVEMTTTGASIKLLTSTFAGNFYLKVASKLNYNRLFNA